MHNVAHAEGAGIGEHDEAEVGRGLVVVELVGGGAVGDEGVVFPAELTGHVSEGEDRAEDEFRVVGRRRHGRRARWM